MIEEIMEEMETILPYPQTAKVKEVLEKFLPIIDEDHYQITDIWLLAHDLADKEFDKLTDSLPEREVYDISEEEFHGKHKILSLNEKYQEIYNGMVDEWEEKFLHYKFEK